MNGKYILVNEKPILEPDVLKWAKWFEESDNARILRQHRFYGYPFRLVSTVFLGLDHNHCFEGPPILWETVTTKQRYGTLRIIGTTKDKANALAIRPWAMLPPWARRKMQRVQNLRRVPSD